MSAKKGQKFKHYPESIKVEAVRLHGDEGWSYSKITEHLEVTDVTQYRVFDEKIYLSAIKDLWNNEIVGYHISRHNDNPLVLETFRKAFEKHKDVTRLIVHSDQGSQYTSHAYHDMLPQVGAQISMSPPRQLLWQRLNGELLLSS